MAKIAFVTPYYWPYLGGIETATRQFAIALTKLGWEIEVHTSWWTSPGAHHAGLLDLDSSIKIHRYKTPRGLIVFAPRLRGSDLVHIHGFHRILMPATLLRTRGTPWILHPHGNISMVAGEPPGISRSLRRACDLLLARFVFQLPARIFCLKAEERDFMVSVGAPPSLCRIIPEPVARELMVLDTNERREGLVLCIGRIVRTKYVDHVIKAFARVGRGHLAIIGPVLDRAYYAELRNEAGRLNIADRVTFLNGVEHGQVSAWYRRAAVTVLPSRVEGQGLVLAEAALQESWPIAAEEGAGSLIRAMGTGSTYGWGDIDGLAHRISEALANPMDLALKAKEGRAWVLANLDPDLLASKVAREYDEVLV